MANQIISQILLYLTDFSKLVQKLTDGADVPGLRYDWLAIFFFAFAIFIVALNLGRSRMFLALLSIYIAVFLENNFIYFDKLREALKDKPEYWLHVGLFLFLYAIISLILNRSILSHRLTLAESALAPVILVAILETGLLAVILLSYFPPELLEKIPPKLAPYFTTKTAQFWWAVVPLLALLLSKHKKVERSQH